MKLNLSEEFNVLIKGNLQKTTPFLLFFFFFWLTLLTADRIYEALGLAFAGFSGSKSGLSFSFEYLSKCFLCVMYVFLCRNISLLSVWANYCLRYSSTCPHVKCPLLILSKRKISSIPPGDPTSSIFYLCMLSYKQMDLFITILLEVTHSLIAKTISHDSV